MCKRGDQGKYVTERELSSVLKITFTSRAISADRASRTSRTGVPKLFQKMTAKEY